MTSLSNDNFSILNNLPFVLYPKVLSHLNFLEQTSIKKVNTLWNQATKTLPGQFALLQAIGALERRSIEPLMQKNPSFIDALSLQVFHSALDPTFRFTNRFLSKVLEIKCRHSPEEMIAFLEKLPPKNREAIQELRLIDRTITKDALIKVVQLCFNLRSLRISSNHITGEEFVHISEKNQLETLNLVYCNNFDEEAFAHFLLLKASKLKNLGLINLNITGECLTKLPKQNPLKILS
ncbi:MAG: hypothetical protein PVI40_06025, partial [Chlamydiota bacterium]